MCGIVKIQNFITLGKISVSITNLLCCLVFQLAEMKLSIGQFLVNPKGWELRVKDL